MTATSLFVCRDPRESKWQLGPLPPKQGSMTLVGWRQVPDPVDAGVPAEVARILADALSAVACVTFPSSDPRTPKWADAGSHGQNQVRVLTTRGLTDFIGAKLKRIPTDIVLLSTRDPETTMQVFDDAGYPWWLQAAVILLSDPDAAPPDVNRETVVALLSNRWTGSATALSSTRVRAIVCPGVDGDVAGLLSLTDAFEQRLLDSLAEECRRHGANWAMVTEDEFSKRLA